MIRRIACFLILAILLCTALPGHADAAAEKGLLITPLREFLSVDAGKSKRSSLTVSNLTNSPMTVDLSVKQFSVSNFTYDYEFSPPTHDWIHLDLTSVEIPPRKSRDIPYLVTVPAGSKPGGNYYTIFASTTMTSAGVKSTIQAADLVYLTVNGTLSRTSELQNSSMPWIAFGRTIPYSMQPVNNGNVHFFVYATGQLHGLFVPPATVANTHLLMPGKTYKLSGNITAPIFPGIYKATFGYKTDGGKSVTRSHWLVYIPPWFIAVALGALLIVGRFLPRRRRQSPEEVQGSSS